MLQVVVVPVDADVNSISTLLQIVVAPVDADASRTQVRFTHSPTSTSCLAQPACSTPLTRLHKIQQKDNSEDRKFNNLIFQAPSVRWGQFRN